MRLPYRKLIGGALFTVVGVGIALALPFMKSCVLPIASATPTAGPQEYDHKTALVGKETLEVPVEVVKRLGVRTGQVKRATSPRPLPPLSGSLALDTNYLARVHSRFAGEVVSLGTTVGAQADEPPGQPTQVRPLRFGDRVEKGELLAVVWSKDLGEKKSELVDCLSRLRLDQENLERLREAYKKLAVPERSLREAERNVESSQIAVARVERTLLAWRLHENEIEAIRKEAELIRQNNGKRVPAQEATWARVEVRAPFDGTILEKNIAVGDIVETTTDLFKIADLTHLCVWAHVYEDDLPALQELARPIHWTVRLKSNPAAAPLQGTISRIGEVIDPQQHTALVMGYVDNARGELRAGQFVTATVELPPAGDEIEVPTMALLEDGRDSVVFVQANLNEPRFTLQRVTVVRRYHDVVYVRVNNKDTALLKPGDCVVIAGALELRAALEELRAAQPSETPATTGG